MGGVLIEAATAGGFTTGLHLVPVALRSLRERVASLLDTLDADDWGRQSRCELWTVHDVVRHVRDACAIHVQNLRREGNALGDEPFDNRHTPLRWLERTAGEPPAKTVDDLRRLAADEQAVLGLRVDEGGTDEAVSPYGRVHWSVLTAHFFWDAWLHERDVAGPLGRLAASTSDEESLACLYGLLIASVPAQIIGRPLAATVSLAGGEGRTYSASVGPGQVRVWDGVASADALQGDLAAVLDSLAGRGPALAAVLHGDAALREPLTWLRPILARPHLG
jgi:uncharacterized protein (TIGR03083 family)